MKIEKEKQKQKSAQDTNATKPDEDDTTSRGSAGGRSQGATKRKEIAEANAEKAKVETERDELREALDILEAHLGTGTRQYDSEDGTRTSRVKKSSMTRVLRSVSKKGARSKEHEIVDLDEEESVCERVARLITHQAGAKGCSSPDSRKKIIRQSPRLSGRSEKSAGSSMRSGSLPEHKLKTLSFAEALASPTPDEQKARGRVETRKDDTRRTPRRAMMGRRKKSSFFDNPLTISDESRSHSLLLPSERFVSRMWRPRPRLTKPCPCPWLRR